MNYQNVQNQQLFINSKGVITEAKYKILHLVSGGLQGGFRGLNPAPLKTISDFSEENKLPGKKHKKYMTCLAKKVS